MKNLVIIPTYNEVENAEKIIRAVLGLSQGFEILIIDDGSPDGTASVVKGLQQEFSDRLHLIERNGKLGLGVVMDGEKIMGIITDGDIRRAVEGAQSNFFQLSVSDVMTKTPKTIDPDAKLTKIQAMFRKYKIHSLLVVDKDEHLIGIVDYFAIMQ